MAQFNFVISQNAKWRHAGFYIDCHRMTVPENILLQKSTDSDGNLSQLTKEDTQHDKLDRRRSDQVNGWSTISVYSTMRLRQRVERVHLRQLLTRGWDNWMIYASECFAVRRRRLESWLETHENYVIGNEGNCYIWHKLIPYSSLLYFLVIPAKAFARDYVITGVRLSVCLFVCLFVCLLPR